MSLIPEDREQGWSGLTGVRRYRHDSTGFADPGSVTEFLAGAGIEVINNAQATLNLHALRFDSFLIMQLKTSGLRLRCARTRLREQERYLFMFVNRGTISIDESTPHWAARHGRLCIVFPGDQPLDIDIPEPGEGILFTVSAEVLSPISLTSHTVGRVEPRSSVLQSSHAFLRAAVEPLSTAEDDDATAPILREMIREVARDIVRAAASTTKAQGLFDFAQKIIGERASDPSFTVSELTQRCGVSRRTLDRAYAAQGLRVGKELRRARARIAMPMIASKLPPSVREIAEASGFSSTEAMRRALSEAYGATPYALSSRNRSATLSLS